MMIQLVKGDTLDRNNLLLRLVDIQYERNDVAFSRGKFPRPRRCHRGLAGL